MCSSETLVEGTEVTSAPVWGAVRYEISVDNKLVIDKDLVDPMDLNRNNIWGNPGMINEETGFPSTIDFQLEDLVFNETTQQFETVMGPVIQYIVYFQSLYAEE